MKPKAWSASDERAFMQWFWRNELAEYKKDYPDAKQLPDNFGARTKDIDRARRAYMAGFRRGYNYPIQ